MCFELEKLNGFSATNRMPPPPVFLANVESLPVALGHDTREHTLHKQFLLHTVPHIDTKSSASMVDKITHHSLRPSHSNNMRASYHYGRTRYRTHINQSSYSRTWRLLADEHNYQKRLNQTWFFWGSARPCTPSSTELPLCHAYGGQPTSNSPPPHGTAISRRTYPPLEP